MPVIGSATSAAQAHSSCRTGKGEQCSQQQHNSPVLTTKGQCWCAGRCSDISCSRSTVLQGKQPHTVVITSLKQDAAQPHPHPSGACTGAVTLQHASLRSLYAPIVDANGVVVPVQAVNECLQRSTRGNSRLRAGRMQCTAK